MHPIANNCFGLLALLAVIHTGLSWALLVAIRNDRVAREEIFGSIKSLVLGPKTVRLKYLFTRSLPTVLAGHAGPVQLLYILARFTGWLATIVLLVVLALVAHAWLAIK